MLYNMLMLYLPTLLKPYDRHLLDAFMKVSAVRLVNKSHSINQIFLIK